MKVLALALASDDKVLALALALTPQALALALALREKSWLFPQDPGNVVAVRVCSAHTHSVT